MKPQRALASAVLLGLPSALLAHALVFGGEHAVGGALQSVAFAAASLVLLFVLAVHSRQAVQGSVLATKLRGCTPHLAVLCAASAAWFVALELCERPHSIPLAAVIACLIAACLIVRAGIAAAAHSIAAVVIAVVRVLVLACAAPAPVPLRSTRAAPQPLRSLAHSGRLFSRPPPAFS